MSVTINSGVKATTSHEGSLTNPPLILNASGTTGTGSIAMSDVIGLTAALSTKLNDTLGTVGATTITATGDDLNLLTGMALYGLTGADLSKLADLTVSTTELNHLAGVTSPIQAQIDAKFAVSAFSATGQLLISTGAGAAVTVALSDIMDGTHGDGVEFGGLKAPTTSLDLNAQRAINAGVPVAATDLATKGYVDDAIGGAGSFLPISGGVLTGDIDLDGNMLTLDPDGDTHISATSDDVIQFKIGGNDVFSFSATAADFGGVVLSDIASPVSGTDAANKDYVDNAAFLPLSGGELSGDLDLNGFVFGLDADGDTSISATTDDLIQFKIGGNDKISITETAITLDDMELTGLADPTSDFGAVSRGFADDRYLRADGTPPGGDINLGGHRLEDVGDPVDGTGVADRDYNDARYLQVSNDLSEVDAATAKTNLGLSTVATTGDYDDLINRPALVGSLDDLSDVDIGTPDPTDDGHYLTWNNGAGSFGLQAPHVVSVFGRTGTITATGGDYTADQIVADDPDDDPTNVQAFLDWLSTNKLSSDGTDVMTGPLDMGSQRILNTALPLSVGGVYSWSTTEYQGGSNGFLMRTTGTPGASTPTYSFVDGNDSGMWFDGANVVVSVDGADQLVVGSATINAKSKRITNVAAPTASTDAVNLGYFEGLVMERLLGASIGIDLAGSPDGTVFDIYTVPSGKSHIITKIIIVSNSYNPGVGGVDPEISIGTGAPEYAQIIEDTVLSWGPAGAADQAVYLFPDQGAETPNSNTVVRLHLDSAAAGTYSALTVSVYVIGIEV